MQTYSFTPSAKCSTHPGLRRFSAFLACCAFWLSCAAGAEAETERHPDVAAALAWSLPESGCASPDSFTSLGDETAQIDVIRHQQTYTSAAWPSQAAETTPRSSESNDGRLAGTPACAHTNSAWSMISAYSGQVSSVP